MRIWRGLAVAVVLLLVMGTSLLAPPAHAAANSYTISSPTVSIVMQNGTTFAYGSNVTPSFTVVLTFATPPSAGNQQIVTVTLDDQPPPGPQTFSYSTPTESADHLTYTFLVDANGTQISVGSHKAVAYYYQGQPTPWLPGGNSATFSVTKGTPVLHCVIQSGSNIVSPGEMLQIETDASAANTSIQVSGTFSIQFIGPQTVTTIGLHPDSNNLVAVPAPAQIGYYREVWCIFEGNASFNSTSMNIAGQPVMVSEKHQLGGADFFSNPTTLIAYQPADVYVVFHAGASLPTPTGYFHINLGDSTTNAVALGPNGDLLLHLDRVPSLAGASQIDVVYQGDPYYDVATFHFPLTNRPIPGGTASGGGSAQGKASPSPGATATAGNGAVPTAATGSGASQTGSGGMLWLWVALVVLVLGGGGAAGTVYFVRRSRRAESSVVGMSMLDGERPGAEVTGNLDGVNRFGSERRWGDGQW